MAESIGPHGTARFGGIELPKPATVVMAYTSTTITPQTKPTFAVVGQRYGIALPAAMEQRVPAVRANGTKVKFRVVPGVAHGFGLGTGTSAEGWVDDAAAFWKKCRREG